MDESFYLSCLLRLWPVEAEGGTHWMASLESPTTGERLGFPDLEALFTYPEWISHDLPYRQPPDSERDNE